MPTTGRQSTLKAIHNPNASQGLDGNKCVDINRTPPPVLLALHEKTNDRETATIFQVACQVPVFLRSEEPADASTYADSAQTVP